MNNNLKIFYNNQDIFQGICPTPFVSFSEDFIDFGTKWNQVTNLTLEGQITGKYLGQFSFNEINNNANLLLERFNENFKSLRIVENTETIYETDAAIINSINFEQSNWYGILPFTMDIKVYDPELYINYYGIIEPTENFSFSEEEGKILSFNHNISAKGIIANNQDPIKNAKDWVLSRSTTIDKILPVFIKNKSNQFLLESSNETIDRFNGVYSLENSYKKSIHEENPVNCFLNYTVDLNSGINDQFIRVNIDGSLEKNNISILRQEYNKLNLFNIANNVCNNIFNVNLSSRPIEQSLTESPNQNRLNFSITYNNDFSSEIVNDYTISMQTDVLTCITTVNLNSQIFCKYGDIKTKWEKVLKYYETEFFPFALIKKEYDKEGTNKNLNINPTTESIKFDEFNANINYTAEYNDKELINQDLLSLTCSVSLNPSINIHAANAAAFIAREHNVQSLENANRTKLTINVSAIAKIDKSINIAETAAINQINKIKNNYIAGKTALLEDKVITRDNNIKSIQISETYTYEGDIMS